MSTVPEISSAPFGRLLTAMVTPFDTAGAVDFALAARLARYLVDQGSDGLIVCGTTGESPTLSWEEQYQLLETVRNAVNGSAKVLAGTGSNSTSEAIHATAKAAEAGADGALVVVPYYNKPPQAGLESHFRAVAQAAPDLPLMLYNIPGRTGCSISPITVQRLMNCSNIVSFKAASGTTNEVTDLRIRCGSRLAIYSGDDGLLLPMLSVGAVGVVSVASHIVGMRLKAMIEAYFAGENSLALSHHEQLQPLFKALFATTNPIPVKAALELIGWPVGAPRSPLLPLENQMKNELMKTISALLQT
ncbi:MULTISPECIES: 4-hydroxy-tetrahydrodipicolinate synthase [Prochlorococcus]|uniref:4-hydroxy-tetrahydrodipicolinate synthase n=1 Tax=Prochlorococcus marinus (strain SARG / CCMP1375 / SS120) TaxID=167539 RepID=DAPA_PROMA|nr:MULTISPECIES: 4-hydroxy-tetrahydrodipicolinate synthase [Prochlorococcus]P49423.2 RecName: Full=4-hydroxy-tetrahydrodipicolinate synthase; Short=HTPA synthase [Prochlorococcus marinus subsp. marinus str. CCMP1375]AAQ00857.1 Dihydrodipicolinate synthase [Prochlorococcus marinus subsp. marinus str. CCMP1375]KGG10647.1 Dihydrodipicolinate synthase [Prochlorococcus marinus str. LG]KGG19887.1 Dihydrodipicolinate synthase [Prochlorococcus marinus str. SS2]KGG23893.1 Dihydrodipicolinate synthase [